MYSPANQKIWLDYWYRKTSSRCKVYWEHVIDKDSWWLIIDEISLVYDVKLDKLIPEGHSFPKLLSDDFWKPTPNHVYTNVWFAGELSSIYHICDFMGWMLKLNNCYWLETGDFFITSRKTLKKMDFLCQLYFQKQIHHWEPLLQPYHDWKFFRWRNTLCRDSNVHKSKSWHIYQLLWRFWNEYRKQTGFYWLVTFTLSKCNVFTSSL